MAGEDGLVGQMQLAGVLGMLCILLSLFKKRTLPLRSADSLCAQPPSAELE